MAPNIVEEKNPQSGDLEEVLNRHVKTDKNYKPQIDWPPLIFHIIMHLLALYGGYAFWFRASWLTNAWGIFLGFITGIVGVGIGAHRYYCHKSFKATKTMQIIMLLTQAMAGQNSMYTWARDHRLHHKYSDTDADPHNINRGFWFAHVGWLVTKKHPLLIEKGRKINIPDLRNDKLLMLQRKYYLPIFAVVGLLIPVCVPMYGWNESFWNSFFVAICLRYVITLNNTWTINSFGHAFGMKPYDSRIFAAQSRVVQFTTLGDGWHNFHHSFPWDYRSCEPGQFSLTNLVINSLAGLGMYYDLKTASREIIDGHSRRHGDGTGENNPANKQSHRRTSFSDLISFNMH